LKSLSGERAAMQEEKPHSPRKYVLKVVFVLCLRPIKWRLSKDRSAPLHQRGTAWQKYGTGPILSVGSPGSWDQNYVQEGAVLAIGDTLHLWYTGMSYSTFRGSIGHATSLRTQVGVVDRDAALPEAFRLAQNYPNPFNPTAAIRYQVSGVSVVKLVVYDILGREVAVLVDEKKAPGSYTVQFNASGLASGMHLYRLTTGSFVQTRKMTLVR